MDSNNAFRCFNISANATVDGFTITKGFYALTNLGGGGVYSNGSSVAISNCKITDNKVGPWHVDLGGGISNQGGLVLTNCVITHNTAAGTGPAALGGGISNANFNVTPPGGGSPVLHVVNCTIGENQTTGDSGVLKHGDGIYNAGVLTVINSIVWGNGEEIYNSTQYSSSFAVSYSDIDQAGYDNADWHNIRLNPQFQTDGYHLQSTSPCIDVGTSDNAPLTTLTENHASMCHQCPTPAAAATTSAHLNMLILTTTVCLMTEITTVSPGTTRAPASSKPIATTTAQMLKIPIRMMRMGDGIGDACETITTTSSSSTSSSTTTTTAPNITTVAGTGEAGYSLGEDGGPAIGAKLDGPSGAAVDSAGNIYIADTYNNRIRKVDTAGNITTVAGNGVAGYSGDGGSATAPYIDEKTTQGPGLIVRAA